jgi:hypothetical protein
LSLAVESKDGRLVNSLSRSKDFTSALAFPRKTVPMKDGVEIAGIRAILSDAAEH